MNHNHDVQSIWFLDFEANKAGDIFLAGVLNSCEFRQIVLDQRLSGLAEHLSVGLEYMNLA